MPVTGIGLLGDVEALRHEQMQVLPGPRHRDIEQAPLFFDLDRIAGRHVRGDAAVDRVQHEHRFPFLAFGRVDGRQDHVVLVAQGRAGFVAGRLGRVERELGEKRLARRTAASEARQLCQVAFANRRVLVQPMELRPIPGVDPLHILRPVRIGAQRIEGLHPRRPVGCGHGWRFEGMQRGHGICGARHRVEQPPRARRADARHELGDAQARHPAARVLCPSQHRENVLYVRGLEKLQPAELHERDVAARELELERRAVVRGAKQCRLALQRDAGLAVAQHLVGDPRGLRRLVGHRHQRGPLRRRRIAPQLLAETLRGERDHGI